MIEIERDIDMYFGMATYIVRGNRKRLQGCLQFMIYGVKPIPLKPNHFSCIVPSPPKLNKNYLHL